MTEEHLSATEVIQRHTEALRMRSEAEALRKQAAEDRAAADYALGQAQHRLKTVQATEAGISGRERKLVELQEPAFLAREQAAADKLAQAQALMAQWNAVKHGAAQALIDINKRDAAREAAARGEAA
ncbi:MAG: hypothetical protein WB689_38670 [Xanthobacteraceae bacterium]